MKIDNQTEAIHKLIKSLKDKVKELEADKETLKLLVQSAKKEDTEPFLCPIWDCQVTPPQCLDCQKKKLNPDCEKVK